MTISIAILMWFKNGNCCMSGDLIEWPARVLNRNPVEDMWNGVKKTIGNLTCHPSKKM